MSRTLTALAVTAVLAGCGSGQVATVTVTSSPPPPIRSAGSHAPAPSATSASSTSAPLPTVHFTNTMDYPRAVWPFTARLASITTNPTGFGGGGGEPPQDTNLMVQVDITSQIAGRMVPAPRLGGIIVCHGPGDRSWMASAQGYDQGAETDPDPIGFNVPLGDGQPHAWDAEWIVPEGTDTSRVKCVFGRDLNKSPIAQMWVTAVGPTRLN